MKRLILAVAACLAITACATPTPYQPYRPGAVVSGGFSEVRIGRDRIRVTFAGNSLTSRETVERYLLYRAAELTVENGYDWFAMADRRTDRESRTIVRRDPFGYDYWQPTWAYLGNGRWILWKDVRDLLGSDTHSGRIAWTINASIDTRPRPRSSWAAAKSRPMIRPPSTRAK